MPTDRSILAFATRLWVPRCLALAVLPIFLSVGCHPSPPAAQPLQLTGQQRLAGHVPAAIRTAIRVSALSGDKQLFLFIALPIRNAESLRTEIQAVSDPRNPQYRHYLTPAQFAAQYGAAENDYAAVIGFARANGLNVLRTYESRQGLNVSASVETIEKVFHIVLYNYRRDDGSTFFSIDREPSVDLNVPILHISGLDNSTKPHPTFRVAHNPSFLNGSAPGGTYGPSDLARAYPTAPGLTGTGQSVALVEFDGFYTGDVSAYQKKFGLNVPTQTVLLDGSDGAPGPDNGEDALDIDMCAAICPALSSVVVFEGAIADSIFAAIASPPSGVPLCGQVSASWTFSVSDSTQQLVNELAIQGQTIFVSSGDSGSYPADPGDDRDMDNITVVGGTELAMNGLGASYLWESTWPKGGGGIGARGIPSYQMPIPMNLNNGSTGNRDLPDVSAVADDVYVIENNGHEDILEGTSISAPVWAAWTAAANQANKNYGNGMVGFINPTLYAIAQTPTQYGADFHDIKDGSSNNSGGDPNHYKAVPGYDLATGLGTPTASLFSAIAPPPTPASQAIRYSSITFMVFTGDDDARADSSVTAAVCGSGENNATIVSYTLKASDANSPAWMNQSEHEATFNLPSPILASDVGSVVITLGQHYVGGFPPETADNWNVQGLRVILHGPDNWHVTLVDVMSNNLSVPLVRLTGSNPSQRFTRSGNPVPSQAVDPHPHDPNPHPTPIHPVP